MRALARLPLRSSPLLRAAVSLAARAPVCPLPSSPSTFDCSSAAPRANRMGGALSLLSPRRGAAAAAAKGGRQAMDRSENEDPDLWMICGLGNPGPRYESTRHNAGFMAVDALAAREGIAMDRLQENAAVGRGRLCGKKVLLVKPMTFMNNSGESVGRLARFYRIPPARCLVICDDLDIPTAAVRLRAKGGHGGQNGMKSIGAHLQGKDFPRIRIGIGRPPGSMPVVSWVLQDLNKAEQEDIGVAVQECIDVVRAVLTVGLERANSGVRVDAEGKPIKPAHSNGKGVKAAQQQQQQGGGRAGKPAKQQQQGAKGVHTAAAAGEEQQPGEGQPAAKRQKQQQQPELPPVAAEALQAAAGAAQ